MALLMFLLSIAVPPVGPAPYTPLRAPAPVTVHSPLHKYPGVKL